MSTVSAVVKKRVEVEKYYVLRGIHVDKNGVKSVIAEKEIDETRFDPFTTDATEEVAQMLVDNPDVTFCSIVENYRLVPTELPFT